MKSQLPVVRIRVKSYIFNIFDTAVRKIDNQFHLIQMSQQPSTRLGCLYHKIKTERGEEEMLVVVII